MEHMGLTEQLVGWCKLEVNLFLFIIFYTSCLKRAIEKSIHHAHHKSCWKSVHHVQVDSTSSPAHLLAIRGKRKRTKVKKDIPKLCDFFVDFPRTF